MAHEIAFVSASVSSNQGAFDLAARICRLLQVTARYLGVAPLPQAPAPRRV